VVCWLTKTIIDALSDVSVDCRRGHLGDHSGVLLLCPGITTLSTKLL
jgi:hypothetical protein